jgi:hypothetical protein
VTVQRYRRKPRQEDREDQFAARYEPGRPLDDLAEVARMADDDAVLTEVGYRGALFRKLAGPYLVVVYSRVPDEHAAEVTAQLVKPGDYLAYSSGNEFLYDSDEAGWRQFYDLVTGEGDGDG